MTDPAELCDRAVRLYPTDPEAAYDLFVEAAQHGFPNAFFGLAEMKMSGVGTERDPEGALELYTAAAEAGHGKAQYVLGSLLLTGEYGVQEDPIMGEIWIRKAISNKEPAAYVALWRALKDGYIKGTPQEGVNALREGVMLGSTEAVCELGILYMEQAEELAEQDPAQSESLTKDGLHLLKIAARDGNLAAAAYLVAYKEDSHKEKGKKKKSAHGKKNRNKGK